MAVPPRVRDDVVHRDEHGQTRLIRLIVYGKPVQQGSKRQVRPGVWIEDAKEALMPWRNAIASAALATGVDPFTGPVQVSLTFFYEYRKQDIRANGEPRPNAPTYKHTPPDLDKLSRAVLDALTQGRIWTDDGLVSVLIAEKRYAPTAGVRIEIRPLVVSRAESAQEALWTEEVGV